MMYEGSRYYYVALSLWLLKTIDSTSRAELCVVDINSGLARSVVKQIPGPECRGCEVSFTLRSKARRGVGEPGAHPTPRRLAPNHE